MTPLQPRTNHKFDPFEPHPEFDDVGIGAMACKVCNCAHVLDIMPLKGMAPKMMKPDEVRREAEEWTAKLFADFHLLHGILERHEAVIQKRWAKKTKTKKLAILLAAWPGMPTKHRPDFAAFRKHATRLNSLAVKLRGSYIWPYINQEDLVKSKSLLLLLNARGRNHPSVFAAADGDAMNLGKVTLAIMPVFLNKHVFMLNGITRDADYGKLVGWDEHEDAFGWAASRKQFIPGEGLLILEAQVRLFAFLVHCCRQILHEIPAGALLNDAVYQVQPEPQLQLKDGADATGLASLAVMAEEAPYRVPQDLDLDKIETLLAARLAAAEDHAWALREDPGYFAGNLAEMREHRKEMIKDVKGRVHPTLKPPRQGALWSRIIGEVVAQAHFSLELFAELHSQARQLRELQSEHAAQIAPLEDLPEPYLASLLKFRHYLQQMAKVPMNWLANAFPASPPMRSHFMRDAPDSADSIRIVTRLRPGKRDPVTGQLVWLLITLWEDDRDLFLCRLPALVDELDRLTAEPRARALLSPYIARAMGDLSIIGECMRQIDSYQPWANGWENALVTREDAIRREFDDRTQAESRILDALHEKNVATIRSFGDPSDNKFYYPVAKRRSQANVDSLRAAEAHLDTFWAKADELVRSQTDGMYSSATRHLLAQSRLLQRTPAWVEPTPRPPRTMNAKAAAPSTASELARPLSTMHLSSHEQQPSARKEVLAAAGSAKTKAKTRGEAKARETADIPPAAAQPLIADRQPRLAVDARALKVFRIVFFDPAANTTPGEVAWLDFLYALQAAGFVAQKLYGSVWHFQPMMLDVERSIQFHEPHPRGKIPFVTARRYGRRLSRAYGWNGGMFVLKDKANGV